MRRKIIGTLSIALFTATVSGHAITSDDCREAFSHDFPNTRVDSVAQAPVKGLCEVHSGVNVLYYAPPDSSNSTRGLLFIGNVYTPGGENLTDRVKKRLESDVVRSIDISNAIKVGSGPVEVIEFSDPDCPYCRKLEAFFQRDDIASKITRYVFLYPLERLHPFAQSHSRWILCQSDPGKALEEVMVDEVLDGKEVEYPASCTLTQTERHLRAAKTEARKIALSGTPLVIVGDSILRGPRLEVIEKNIDRLWQRRR